MNIKFIIPALVLVIGIIGYFAFFPNSESISSSESLSESIANQESLSESISAPVSTLDVMVTNGQKHIIPLDKIKGGGPPKDGIPSIDNPKFATVENSQFISDSDVVIGLKINGEVRAYPLFILVWHEIVNDEVGEVPVAVTYCPLCYTNQVFERIVNGNVVEFGTSGKLYNSNLLMYDRLTESYWSQGLGLAVTGELSGHKLKIIPFDVITWGDWKTLYPETLVLTTDTGHIRSYATDPYGDYYTDPRIIFPVDNKDDRMHPKEIILGFNEGGIYKAYKQSDVELAKIINDEIGDTSVLLISSFHQNSRAFDRTVNGEIFDFQYEDGKIVDIQTNSDWNYEGNAISGPMEGSQLSRIPIEPGFWFSWVSFYPETQIYGET